MKNQTGSGNLGPSGDTHIVVVTGGGSGSGIDAMEKYPNGFAGPQGGFTIEPIEHSPDIGGLMFSTSVVALIAVVAALLFNRI